MGLTARRNAARVPTGKPKTLNSAYTNVWIKGPKGWQMVAWQSTPLPA